MEKVAFKNIKAEIINLLSQADKEVFIAMAWFTNNELFLSLIDCLKRGIKVELVLLDNAINFMPYAPDFNEFIKQGGVFHIARAENKFMHHKFCVIDDSCVITGSYNWTYYAEKRNNENIIISDNAEVIAQYVKEFKSLAISNSKVSSSPCYDWNQIENYQNIDFESLNYEVDSIVRACNLPEKTIVKSSTIVTIEEQHLNPVSNYNIGMKVTKHGDNSNMEIFVPQGIKLPFTSDEKKFYNYSDHRENIVCSILYSGTKEKHLVVESPITEITAGNNKWELTIKVQFTLVESGDLFARIRCVETGKVINVKTSNPNFVNYAE